MSIKYKEQDVLLNFVPYSNTGNTALEILDENSNLSLEVVTVNITQPLPKDIIIIKQLNHTDETISNLINAGVILPEPQGEYDMGYTNVIAYKLSSFADNIRKKQYKLYQYESLYK